MWSRNEIINRLLSRLSNDTQKVQGSFSYDNIGAVGNELAMLHEMEIKGILNKALLDTATGDILTNLAKDKGVIRKLATYAKGEIILIGTKGIVIPKETQVSNNQVIYTTINDVTIGESGHISVDVICTQSGETGNTDSHTIKYLPISVSGLHDIYNEKAITGGYEEERDEELRNRVYMHIREPASSGNIYDYKRWSLEVEGVGAIKVIPTYAGAGTVKIIVTDANGQPAKDELLDLVYNYIEQKRPIGASVTVCSAEALPIDIEGILILESSSEENKIQVRENVVLLLKKYFIDTVFKNLTEISYAKINYIILSCVGVNDIIGLKINNDITNIQLNDKVPIVGNIKLE